jgi:cyclophilin family peptidyl-prolyl cis-trans isomerase
MNNKYLSIIIVVLVIVLGVWLYKENHNNNQPPVEATTPTSTDEAATPPPVNSPTSQTTNQNNQSKIMTATIKTNKGNITIEFFSKDAPNTVANFEKLAGEGFYNGTKFHRVILGFMIQGGDPLSKDNTKQGLWGTGGPGYQFADEIDPNSALYKAGYLKGIVAMANSGPNTNGSQLFIMDSDYPLPPLYTIFGKVDSGQYVVDAIDSVKTDPSNDRPIDPVIINSITINK